MGKNSCFGKESFTDMPVNTNLISSALWNVFTSNMKTTIISPFLGLWKPEKCCFFKITNDQFFNYMYRFQFMN